LQRLYRKKRHTNNLELNWIYIYTSSIPSLHGYLFYFSFYMPTNCIVLSNLGKWLNTLVIKVLWVVNPLLRIHLLNNTKLKYSRFKMQKFADLYEWRSADSTNGVCWGRGYLFVRPMADRGRVLFILAVWQNDILHCCVTS